METTVERSVESREAAIRRLAQRARESGIRLVCDRRDGRHYASSLSEPGRWHLVTGYSCDCIGFARHGRCSHHSALMVALGWVGDETPEPEPPAANGEVVCWDCLDTGVIKHYYGGLSDWETSVCPCGMAEWLRRAA